MYVAKKDSTVVSQASSYLNARKNRPVILVGLIIVFLLIGFTILYFNQQRKIDVLENKVTDLKKDSHMEKKKKISPKPLSPSSSSREANDAVNTNQGQQVQNQNQYQEPVQQGSQNTVSQDNVPCVYMMNYADTYVNNETASVILKLDEITTVPVTVEIVGSNQSQMETVASATINPGNDTWSGYVNTKPYMTNLSTRDSCSSPAPGDGTYLVRTESTDGEDIDPDNLPTPKESTQEYDDAVMLCVAERSGGDAYQIIKQDCANSLGYDVNTTIETEQTQIQECGSQKISEVADQCSAENAHLR